MNLFKTDKFKVDFIGVGAGRSGTTWIAKCLSEHPKIFIPKVKELEFFNREINVFEKINIFNNEKKCFSKYDKQGKKSYRQYFLEAKKGQIRGEWSVKYLHEPAVAEKIKKAFPEVKILVCLRNPIDRAYSQFYFAKYRQKIEKCCQNFTQAFKKHPHFYRYNSLYHKQVKRYLDLFPKKNVLVLIYEDMQKNPRQFIQTVYRFLGVNSSFTPPSLAKKINPTVEYSYPLLVKIYSQSARIVQKMGMRTLANVFKKTGIKKLLDLAITEKIVSRPPMEPKTREGLQKIFAEDIKKLETLIGRDLSFWK